jgi:hypothetical protein
VVHRILVIAHRTLGGPHLLDEVRQRIVAGDCAVHLLVPQYHPTKMATYTDSQIHAMAQRVLEDGMHQIRRLDSTGKVDVTGEVGDINPVHAVDVLLTRGMRFDEILLSTLPVGPSRWLKADVPSRMSREFRIPLIHVVAEPAPVS